MKIFLTSEVILDFLIGKETVVKKIKYYSKEDLYITPITLMELKLATSDPSLYEFLTFVNVAPFDEESANLAIEILKTTSLTTAAAIEASICIRNHGLLYARHREKFEGVKNLNLV